MKGSEKFKRGTSGRGKFVRNTFDTDEFEKGKEEKRERESEISFKAKFDRGWNTGEMEQQFLHHCAESAEGRKEEGCRDNNLKKWCHAGGEQNSYDSAE